jgi:hypothetical protein
MESFVVLSDLSFFRLLLIIDPPLSIQKLPTRLHLLFRLLDPPFSESTIDLKFLNLLAKRSRLARACHTFILSCSDAGCQFFLGLGKLLSEILDGIFVMRSASL